MGKTKDILSINADGTCVFRFKDDACGENGVFDPGANQIGLKIGGMGRASLLLSRYFFEILESEGVRTHYVNVDGEQGTMTCHKLTMIPIEFIWRDRAWGSFCKLYGVEQGYPLNGLIEATVKSDALGDPRINREAIVLLGKMTDEQYDKCDKYTRRIGTIFKRVLEKFDYSLIDCKVEFGINAEGEIMMGDEISGGIWRLLDKEGKPVDPIESAKRICGAQF